MLGTIELVLSQDGNAFMLKHKQEPIDTLLAQDELDNIDTEFDNEYNAVVDNIYVKTFYTSEEN